MLYIIGKILETILIVMAVAFLAWVTISYVDVLAHNLHTGYEYPFWNFFSVLL